MPVDKKTASTGIPNSLKLLVAIAKDGSFVKLITQIARKWPPTCEKTDVDDSLILEQLRNNIVFQMLWSKLRFLLYDETFMCATMNDLHQLITNQYKTQLKKVKKGLGAHKDLFDKMLNSMANNQTAIYQLFGKEEAKTDVAGAADGKEEAKTDDKEVTPVKHIILMIKVIIDDFKVQMLKFTMNNTVENVDKLNDTAKDKKIKIIETTIIDNKMHGIVQLLEGENQYNIIKQLGNVAYFDICDNKPEESNSVQNQQGGGSTVNMVGRAVHFNADVGNTKFEPGANNVGNKSVTDVITNETVKEFYTLSYACLKKILNMTGGKKQGGGWFYTLLDINDFLGGVYAIGMMAFFVAALVSGIPLLLGSFVCVVLMCLPTSRDVEGLVNHIRQ
jgi:hypothetical protein